MQNHWHQNHLQTRPFTGKNVEKHSGRADESWIVGLIIRCCIEVEIQVHVFQVSKQIHKFSELGRVVFPSGSVYGGIRKTDSAISS